MDTNESVVAMSAVRYMLGRNSYGVGSVCDYLKANKEHLTQSNRQVIVRDIREHLDNFPDTPQSELWVETAELLTQNNHDKT